MSCCSVAKANARQHGTSILSYANSLAAWKISATATGLRQLAIVTLLRPFMESPRETTILKVC